MKARRRGRRAKSLPVVLTERDLDMLTLAGLCGYASSAHLARACFPSPDRCRRRLRQLFDAGLLSVTLAGSTTPNLVSLTEAGRRAVAEVRPDLAGDLRLAGSIRLHGVRHHLAVVDVRLYLAALASAHGGALVRFEGGRGGLATELGFTGSLVPDAVAVLTAPGVRRTLAIEVDCATEGTRVIERKLAAYEPVLRGGTVDELWIVVVGAEARVAAVSGLVSNAGLADVVRVLRHDDLLRRPVLVPGAEAAAGGTRAIGPYSASPSTLNSESSPQLPHLHPARDRRADG